MFKQKFAAVLLFNPQTKTHDLFRDGQHDGPKLWSVHDVTPGVTATMLGSNGVDANRIIVEVSEVQNAAK